MYIYIYICIYIYIYIYTHIEVEVVNTERVNVWVAALDDVIRSRHRPNGYFAQRAPSPAVLGNA